MKMNMLVWLTVGLLISAHRATARPPQVKIAMTIHAPIEQVFNYIVPVDLAHVFKRYKSLPAVVNTSIKEGWTKPGLSRTVYFEDGSTSQESMLTLIPHTSFSYSNKDFTSSLRFLVKTIDGKWLFTDLGNGETKAEWTYTLNPKNFVTRGVINLAVKKNLRRYLTNALVVLKDDLESGRFKNTQNPPAGAVHPISSGAGIRLKN